MEQLIFKFPFKTTYFQKDFYVSDNNFSAYKLIESCPKWPNKWINIFGPKGCGKTHLSIILEKKLKLLYIDSAEFKNVSLGELEKYECIILDNFNNNIDEKLLYSILNQSIQLNKLIIINSLKPIRKMKINLNDLKSRIEAFVDIGIELPTDELLRVIIIKSFSDKQININTRLLEYIIKNIDRSYENVFNFIKKIDDESLSSGKSININLIKKVLEK